ncbi:MAG: hypothetical protein ACOY3N_30855 [Bradyrhizobium sp.]|uniref:hypothetical protein n=1 Tax=Bradyrhizobium sp. TaxID=376 RepID=UPI00349B4C08
MWLQTICLTLLYFLVSTGFGLFILALASTKLLHASGLSRLELLIIAFTIGAPGSGTFLQLLCLVQRDLDIDLAALSTIALVGLVSTRRLWQPGQKDLREISIWIAVVVPLGTMTWWWSFGAISRFPFADIGADVHWMKIAREFADTGVLNPYAGQTYLDLRAATAGLLSGTLGLDLLQFHWVYRFLSILCLGMFFYAAADRVFADFGRRWFAVFFAVATNSLAILTNGSLAVASSFVFLTALLSFAPGTASGRPLPSAAMIVPAAAALGAAVVAFLLNNNALLLAVLATSLLCLNGFTRLRGGAGQASAAILLVTATWPMSLMFVHRSAYLFVGVVIAGWLFYLLLLKVAARPKLLLLRCVWTASLVLPSLCVAILIYVAAAHAGYTPKVNANGLFDYLARLSLGRGLNEGDEIMLGAGPEVAAIELGRAIGPSFAILAGVLYIWWTVKNSPTRLLHLMSLADQSKAVVRLLWSWNLAFALCLGVLSGLPFMYRIVFIVLGLFTITTTELFWQLFADRFAAPVKSLRRISCFGLALITLLTVGLYAFGWWPDLPYSSYQAMLRPAQIGTLMIAALCTAFTFSSRRRVQILAATATISLSVAIDRSAIVNLFRVYSYGRPPAGANVISHYDASDLATDRWLHQNLPKSIVITDPATLAMAKAMAGVAGIYLFSNLDTVNPLVAENVKEMISAIVHPEQDHLRATVRACTLVAPMLAVLNSEARAQMGTASLTGGILRAVRPGEQQTVPPKGDATLRPIEKEAIERAMGTLHTPDGAWNLIAIINPRTVQWLRLGSRDRLSYFPVDQPLDTELLDRLHQGAFPLLFSDGQNAVVSLPCARLTAP